MGSKVKQALIAFCRNTQATCEKITKKGSKWYRKISLSQCVLLAKEKRQIDFPCLILDIMQAVQL